DGCVEASGCNSVLRMISSTGTVGTDIKWRARITTMRASTTSRWCVPPVRFLSGLRRIGASDIIEAVNGLFDVLADRTHKRIKLLLRRLIFFRVLRRIRLIRIDVIGQLGKFLDRLRECFLDLLRGLLGAFG